MTTQFFKAALMSALLITLAIASPFAAAQHSHSDIEFEYDNDKIAIEFGSEGRVFEADFAISGAFEQETDDPGIASEPDEGMGVNADDIIDYQILGPLEYHNGTAFATVPTGGSIVIGDNPTGGLTVDANTIGPASGSGIIAMADSLGEVHTHVEYFLDPISFDTDEYGAYALLMQLTTDASGIAPSDPFYVVFNFGLEESVFENAVGAFATKVPEPTSLAFAAAAMVLGLKFFPRRSGI
ncbi:MAG: hypothetical protein MK171_12530 [Pirellulales bacterium]|nr:hypothetical protein [Pirellulales bacterium]